MTCLSSAADFAPHPQHRADEHRLRVDAQAPRQHVEAQLLARAALAQAARVGRAPALDQLGPEPVQAGSASLSSAHTHSGWFSCSHCLV